MSLMVSFDFMFFSGRYAFHLWKPLGQAITETAKKISTSVSLEVTQYQLNLFICQIFRSKSFYDILCHFIPARFIFFSLGLEYSLLCMFCHLFGIFLKSSNKLLGRLPRGIEELVFFVCNSHMNKKTSTSISLHISCLFLGAVPKLLSVAVCMSQIWCYRIIGVGRDVWRSSSTASLLKQVP